jgi:hypothetical protein
LHGCSISIWALQDHVRKSGFLVRDAGVKSGLRQRNLLMK